jgi:hypothetical protein
MVKSSPLLLASQLHPARRAMQGENLERKLNLTKISWPERANCLEPPRVGVHKQAQG